MKRVLAIARDYSIALRWRAVAMLPGSPPQEWREGTGHPVVLVPGVWERWPFLRTIGQRLHEAGHPVHIVPDLLRNSVPIPDAAAMVYAAIERLDLRRVRIVSHSKGGLIGKHLLANYDAAARIDRVVAIATPFAGSVRAVYSIPRALREFRPASPVIRALVAETAANARITSIYGAYDFHVPAGSALDGAVNVEVPYIGHFGVLTDERVIAEVLKAVAD
jgi:pimeloyl-ACP methyl ester carboxylesterase